MDVFSKVDSVFVKGAGLGERIWVYATSSTLVKSMATYQDVMKIKLPANEIYIIELGKARYKVALEVYFFTFGFLVTMFVCSDTFTVENYL